MSEDKIKNLTEEIKKDPNNLNNYRALADIYIDKQDFKSAFNI